MVTILDRNIAHMGRCIRSPDISGLIQAEGWTIPKLGKLLNEHFGPFPNWESFSTSILDHSQIGKASQRAFWTVPKLGEHQNDKKDQKAK